MKVRTKKGIVDTTKSIDDLSKSFSRLGKTAKGTVNAVNGLNQAFYINWKSGFKPQSQSVICVIVTTVILLAIAEIAWYIIFIL